MRVAVHNHYGEADAIVLALAAAGHEITNDGPTDLFLIDLDPDGFGYREVIDFYHEQGAIVLQYPHGAPTSLLAYDSLYEPYGAVDGQLSHARGEIEFLRRLQIPRPARVLGWSYTHQLPFRPCAAPRRVVFGPVHPNGDRSMRADQKDENRDIFERLLSGPWNVTVRFVGALGDNGLWADTRCDRYVQGHMDMSTAEIDGADVVVAGYGTFPALAVSRGCPTVTYAQLTANLGVAGEPVRQLRRPHLYEDLVRYPYDLSDGPLDDLLRVACATEATGWRENWVGEQFEATSAARMIENFVGELRAARDLRAPSPTPSPGTEAIVPLGAGAR